MSLSLAVSLFTILVSAVSVAMVVRLRRIYRRRLQELEAALAAHELSETLRRGIATALAARAGADLVEPIRVEDIKYGDKVCWRQTDGSNHQHYVAGYDGDPGPSADGIHARKIIPKGL